MGTEAHSLGWFLFLFKPLSSSRDLDAVCLLLQLETLMEVWSEEFSLVAQPEQSLTERDSVCTKALNTGRHMDADTSNSPAVRVDLVLTELPISLDVKHGQGFVS